MATGGPQDRTGPPGCRQMWVGPPKAEGLENKEATGTDRR